MPSHHVKKRSLGNLDRVARPQGRNNDNRVVSLSRYAALKLMLRNLIPWVASELFTTEYSRHHKLRQYRY